MRLVAILIQIQLCFASVALGIGFHRKSPPIIKETDDWWTAAKKAVEKNTHNDPLFQQSLHNVTMRFFKDRLSQAPIEVQPSSSAEFSPFDWLTRYKLFSFLKQKNIDSSAVHLASLDEVIPFISKLTPSQPLRYAILLRAIWDETLMREGLYNLTDDTVWDARALALHAIPAKELTDRNVKGAFYFLFTPEHLTDLFTLGARELGHLPRDPSFYNDLFENALAIFQDRAGAPIDREKQFLFLVQVLASPVWQKRIPELPQKIWNVLHQMTTDDPSLWGRMKLRVAALMDQPGQSRLRSQLFETFGNTPASINVSPPPSMLSRACAWILRIKEAK